MLLVVPLILSKAQLGLARAILWQWIRATRHGSSLHCPCRPGATSFPFITATVTTTATAIDPFTQARFWGELRARIGVNYRMKQDATSWPSADGTDEVED